MTKCLLDIALLAAIVVYIVDVSGWTESWRSGLSRLLGIRHLRDLPPFDCGKCASFWAGIIYAAVTGHFTLPVLAFVCGCSLMAQPLGELLTLLREATSYAISAISAIFANHD